MAALPARAFTPALKGGAPTRNPVACWQAPHRGYRAGVGGVADQSGEVRRHGHPRPVALVPELSLVQADADTGLWTLSGGEYRSDQPPPFWLFAWAGGQALARYLLDHPETVAGARVLDLASGSGLVAVAAARAGAARVLAVDVDPDALAATALNATANGVQVDLEQADALDPAAGWDTRLASDVVLAGDAFYSAALSRRVLALLRRAHRQGATVLVGDADRGHLPTAAFTRLAGYQVPVSRAVEGTDRRPAAVWRLAATGTTTPTDHAR